MCSTGAVIPREGAACCDSYSAIRGMSLQFSRGRHPHHTRWTSAVVHIVVDGPNSQPTHDPLRTANPVGWIGFRQSPPVMPTP
jgi:hypothetical protein